LRALCLTQPSPAQHEAAQKQILALRKEAQNRLSEPTTEALQIAAANALLFYRQPGRPGWRAGPDAERYCWAAEALLEQVRNGNIARNSNQTIDTAPAFR